MPQKQPPARTADCLPLASKRGVSTAGVGKGVFGVSGGLEPSARSAVQATRPIINARAIPLPITGLFMFIFLGKHSKFIRSGSFSHLLDAYGQLSDGKSWSAREMGADGTNRPA